MSNELKIGVTMSFKKSGAEIAKAKNISVDVTGDSYTAGVQEIGTANEEVVQGGEVGTPGYVYLRNLHASASIQVGPTNTTEYLVKLLAGQFCIFPLETTATGIWAKASAAANLEFIIFEL